MNSWISDQMLLFFLLFIDFGSAVGSIGNPSTN